MIHLQTQLQNRQQEAYTFINKIQNRNTIPKKERIKFAGNTLSTDEMITNGFATYYSSSQKKTHYLKHQDRIVQRLLSDKIKGKDIPDTNDLRIFYEDFSLHELRIAINLKTKNHHALTIYLLNSSTTWDTMHMIQYCACLTTSGILQYHHNRRKLQ